MQLHNSNICANDMGRRDYEVRATNATICTIIVQARLALHLNCATGRGIIERDLNNYMSLKRAGNNLCLA
jgi:hypothetical protein